MQLRAPGNGPGGPSAWTAQASRERSLQAPPITYVQQPQAGSYAPAQVVAPRRLTDGMPSPDSIETQKRAYARSLDEEQEQQMKAVADRVGKQKAILRLQAEQQLAMYKTQVDQYVRQQELSLEQELQRQQMEIQQAHMSQKAVLEKQAATLTIEYQQRKMQEDLIEQQTRMQQEMQQMQRRMTEEMANHHQQAVLLQQQHDEQQVAHQQQVRLQHDQLQRQAAMAQAAAQAAGAPSNAYNGTPRATMACQVRGIEQAQLTMRPQRSSVVAAPPQMPQMSYSAGPFPGTCFGGSPGPMPVMSSSAKVDFVTGIMSPAVPYGKVYAAAPAQQMPVQRNYSAEVQVAATSSPAAASSVVVSNLQLQQQHPLATENIQTSP